jgi:hypothetical protein
MKYERLFESFGPSVWGKIAAATVIGAVAFVGIARKVEGAFDQIGWLPIAAAGAAIGCFAGVLLGIAEVRGKRIEAGTAKPMSGKGVALMIVGGIALFFVVCLWIVFH